METPIFHLDSVVKSRAEQMQDFDGPLDLILHLLSKNKMEIKDIQISVILDQYLQWMEQRKEMDLEVSSEFLVLAATLLQIKSKMLLPSEYEEEEEDPRDELVRRLVEYKMFKETLFATEIYNIICDKKIGNEYRLKQIIL